MGEMMDGKIPTMAHPHGQSLLFTSSTGNSCKETDW
jgi:hypothetical protein